MTDFEMAPGVLHRGLGFVARWPGITVVIPSDPAQDRVVEKMLSGFGPEPGAAEVIRVVNEELQKGSIRTIGYLATASGGPLAMVAGAVEVVVDGVAVLTGFGGPVERHLAANERITVRAAKLAKAAGAVYPYDLRRGIAPGAGITLGVPVSTTAGSPASPPRPDHAPPEIASTHPPERTEVEVPFQSFILLDDDLPSTHLAPLPVGRTQHRPTLGFIVFDDGSTFGLDRSYLIGREPGDPTDSATAPLTIQDNNETLSRRHAELHVADWSVQLIDLGSTNGTFVWDASIERWSQLAPNQPVELAPGDTVALGRRTFVYESVIHH